jgi:hypothetical protein
MIHIIFQQADREVLQNAIALDESLNGPIIEIKDDFAVGPITDLYSEEGIERRKTWWREVLAGGDYDGIGDDGHVNDQQAVIDLKLMLDGTPDEVAWIWAAQNKHDVSGYYWLVSQLSAYQGRIYILYLNNLPFFNEKGSIFYPEDIHKIPPKELLKAKRLARPVTASEFEVDTDEWQKLAAEEKGVRLLEGGKKLVQKEYDYYDSLLHSYISGEWQKAGKVITQFLTKGKQHTGDAFLLWRLKAMLVSGDYDVQGEVGNMKAFEIRRKEAVVSS